MALTGLSPQSVLSLRQKVGQLMMFGFHGTEPSSEIIRFIRDYHVGGIILFARNIGKPADVLKLTVALQKIAYEAGHPFPLLISLDQENGIVRRLGAGTTLLPGNMAIGATGNANYAYQVAHATGRELKALGINLNLAPVLDINNNPNNPVIGVRSYGEDPEWVAECGVEAIRGLQEAGIATCGKHFPGHGDTHLDSHLSLPSIPHSRERLEQIELLPFKKAIQSGIDTVMIAHVCFPQIEPDPLKPATISRRVIEDLLRGEIGFQGVITTDCMEMKAIADTIGVVEGVYQSFKAGTDLIFVSHSHDLQERAIERLVAAIEDEGLEQRLEESVARILELKSRYLSWDEIAPYFDQEEFEPDPLVGGSAHEQLARSVMEAAVTLTKNEDQIIPLQLSDKQQVGVIFLKNTLTSLVEDERYLVNPLAQAVKKVHQNTKTIELSNPPTEQEIESLPQAVDGCSAVVVGTMNAQLSPQQVKMVKRLTELKIPLVVVSLRTPYELAAFPEIAAHVATYEFSPVAADVAVEGIFGKIGFKGHLPVTIPGVSKLGDRSIKRRNS